MVITACPTDKIQNDIKKAQKYSDYQARAEFFFRNTEYRTQKWVETGIRNTETEITQNSLLHLISHKYIYPWWEKLSCR